ncbi:Uroporphyrinogen III synthase HEM4 [Methanosalsum zhilinae DSM 4017]|uniref:Uroporphyrinogen III synthase HEM4 n=1 Tax=Methanosalsum zhilinae (strain DSM 4017 / NBRC 107636 / OCM 62 / WeN5) TaxID=679901 RepID=F7XMW6_METZD|nr:uroporphyrinogen-III synthase [Methanosalsum zhilinae]AEH59983.1 Uroporphyrinogen III synthase HEM4 [Methanosalsum zhilinae DSM 4017]
MKVAVTKLKEKDKGTVRLFAEYGHTAYLTPTIRSKKPDDPSSLRRLLGEIKKAQVDYLIFTSSLGVTYFFNECDHLDTSITIISIGPETASSVRENGFSTEMLPAYSSEHFSQYLHCRAWGKTIGVARAGVPNTELIRSLEDLGARVIEGICYELVAAGSDLKDLVANSKVDAVVFTSSKSFSSSRLTENDLRNIITVAIGPKTADTMTKNGTEPDITGTGTLESCARELNAYKKI